MFLLSRLRAGKNRETKHSVYYKRKRFTLLYYYKLIVTGVDTLWSRMIPPHVVIFTRLDQRVNSFMFLFSSRFGNTDQRPEPLFLAHTSCLARIAVLILIVNKKVNNMRKVFSIYLPRYCGSQAIQNSASQECLYG